MKTKNAKKREKKTNNTTTQTLTTQGKNDAKKKTTRDPSKHRNKRVRVGPPSPPTLVAEIAADLALEFHPETVQLVQPVGDGLAVPAEREVERVVDRPFLVALFLLLLSRRAPDSKT